MRTQAGGRSTHVSLCKLRLVTNNMPVDATTMYTVGLASVWQLIVIVIVIVIIVIIVIIIVVVIVVVVIVVVIVIVVVVVVGGSETPRPLPVPRNFGSSKRCPFWL